MAEPPAKKAKVGEDGEAEKKEGEETAEPEVPQENEEDAVEDKKPKVDLKKVGFNVQDTTMNVMPSSYGNLLMSLSDGGMQYLVAGARTNIGVKSGRYYFEAKIVEYLAPMDDPTSRSRTPQPRNYLRIGVALPGSSLFLGETEDSVCFDLDGAFIHNKKKEQQGQRFGKDVVVGVLINLEDGHPNKNTVSLFKGGVRASQPQPLPASMTGKVLYPAFSYRNVTLKYNFGPLPEEPLPFKCRMVGTAAKTDTKEATQVAAKDGKYEVLYPTCLPDEGTFDWLDFFLEKNPQYTELSDRMILSWLEKSGVLRPKGYGFRTSNDKPEMGFAVPMIDDCSIRKILMGIAPAQQRHYIVMEVKSALLPDDRAQLLAPFKDLPQFSKIALILLSSDPPAEFKKYSQQRMLKAKKEASDAEFLAKKAEEKRKKMIEKRQKDLEKQRKKAEKEKKKAEEERKRKMEEEKKKKEAEEKGEEYVPEEAAPMEEEEPEEDEKEEADEEMEGPPPDVELTPEEKKAPFRKSAIPDLSAYIMSTSFTKFCLPQKEEGFDDLRFDWEKGEKAEEYLRQWIVDRKVTTRIEELVPSQWFAGKWKEWQKTLQSWHQKQNEFKASVARKAAEKNAKAALKAKKEAEIAAKKRLIEAKKENGEEVAADEEELKKEEEAKEEEEEEKDERIDFEKLDVFGVENVLNVGGGEPLFSNFAFEDWTMMTLRFELHLLAHSFKKDANDPQRPGIYSEHLPFYYTKYYKKTLNPKFYGVDAIKDLVEMIRDTIVVNPKSQVLEPQLPEDMESLGIFAMLTEECRRDRQRRVDMGEESAKLKLTQPSAVMASNLMPNVARGPVANPGMVQPKPFQAVAPGAAAPGMPAVRPAGQTWFGSQGFTPNVVRPGMGTWPQQRPFQPAGGGWRPGGW